MLQETDGLSFDKANDHVTQDCSHSVESLIGSADVSQTSVIEQNLLDDEDGHGLGELTAGFHDSETEWNDLSRQEERDCRGRIVCVTRSSIGVHRNTGRRLILDQGTNDTQRGKSEILKWSRLGRGVEEGIEEQWNVRCRVH